MNQSLSNLIHKKNKQAKAGRGRIDWNQRRDRYIAAVDDLYRQIEAMFSQALKKKKVSLQRHPKQLSETYIGTYSIDDLILLIGDEQVRLSPQGRNVAGAAGRVDVLGERSEVILLLQPDSGWGFLQSRQPKLIIIPFNEASFTEVLQLVMRD